MKATKGLSGVAPWALAVTVALLGASCASGGDASDTTAAPDAAAQSDTVTDLNGTYRWTLTQEDADKAGDLEEGYPLTTTVTLEDGELEGGCFGAAGGTYKVDGDQIIFHSFEYDSDATVTFSVDDEGNLHLTPDPKMDPGDAFTCFSKPWTKIG